MLAGAPSLCCNTEDVPVASIKYDGSALVIDLKQAPGLLAKGSAGKIVDQVFGQETPQ